MGLCLAEGLLHVELRPVPGDAERARQAFAAAVKAELDASHQLRMGLVTALWQALADDPAVLAGTLPPISELAAAACPSAEGSSSGSPASARNRGG